MRTRFLVGRLTALPLRHKLIAAGIVVAFIAGYLVWSLRLPPREYSSSALLFFDQSVAPEPAPGIVRTGQARATELADSILSDDLVDAICKQFGLYADSSGAEAARFRANLMLSGESTSSLRVTWRGNDRSQTVAVTNAIAVQLTSWVPEVAHQSSEPAPPLPAPPPTPIDAAAPIEPKPPVEAVYAKSRPSRARIAMVLNDEKELQALLAAADKRMVALGDEARGLEARIGQANAERQASINARQPLTEQLATEKKRLDQLRVRYTDAYPDVEAAQERITETEQKLAAIPVRPVPDADQSRLNAVTKEISRVGAEKVRLSDELSKKVALQTKLDSQEVESFEPATRPAQASTEPQAEQIKPRFSDHAPLPAPVASSLRTVESTDGEPVRAFKILERAANAQPANNPRRQPGGILALAGPLCGALYLLVAVWWFHAVPNAEALERIVPESVAYLGAIPEIKTWRHSV